MKIRNANFRFVYLVSYIHSCMKKKKVSTVPAMHLRFCINFCWNRLYLLWFVRCSLLFLRLLLFTLIALLLNQQENEPSASIENQLSNASPLRILLCLLFLFIVAETKWVNREKLAILVGGLDWRPFNWLHDKPFITSNWLHLFCVLFILDSFIRNEEI